MTCVCRIKNKYYITSHYYIIAREFLHHLSPTSNPFYKQPSMTVHQTSITYLSSFGFTTLYSFQKRNSFCSVFIRSYFSALRFGRKDGRERRFQSRRKINKLMGSD